MCTAGIHVVRAKGFHVSQYFDSCIMSRLREHYLMVFYFSLFSASGHCIALIDISKGCNTFSTGNNIILHITRSLAHPFLSNSMFRSGIFLSWKYIISYRILSICFHVWVQSDFNKTNNTYMLFAYVSNSVHGLCVYRYNSVFLGMLFLQGPGALSRISHSFFNESRFENFDYPKIFHRQD